MIPLSTFNILLVAVILLVIYSLVDHRNKIYGNIAAAIIASILSLLLAILIYIGAVQTDAGTAVNDFPTAGALLLIWLAISGYAVWMVIDAKEEYEMAKEQL